MTDSPPRFRGLIDPPTDCSVEEIDAALPWFREMAEKYPLDFGPAVQELEEAREMWAELDAELAALKEAEARMTPNAGGIDGQAKKD